MSGFTSLGARLYRWFYGRPKSNLVIVEMAELVPGDRVLDVGCGPGAAVRLAAERIGAGRISAADPTPSFVDTVRQRVPGVDARVAVAESLPFDDEAFTVIWTVAAMHHWDDRDAGLKEVASKLAPGGRLLLMERLLGKPGHGITDEQTADVVALLRGFGLTSIDTSEPDRKHRLIRAFKDSPKNR